MSTDEPDDRPAAPRPATSDGTVGRRAFLRAAGTLAVQGAAFAVFALGAAGCTVRTMMSRGGSGGGSVSSGTSSGRSGQQFCGAFTKNNPYCSGSTYQGCGYKTVCTSRV